MTVDEAVKRRLIVCCDGTWNDPEHEDGGEPAPTNVVRLRNALIEDPDTQQVHYQAGVGTEGPADKVLGGAFGFGLDEDIRECYRWLVTKYRAGDALCLFGFSRGAFTARCLAAIVCRFGIVDKGKLPEGRTVEWATRRVYAKGYRNGQGELGLEFHHNSDSVAFLGVWDTVGALGVPDDKAFLNLFDVASRYQFHDVSLSGKVACARHAVAIDEVRGSFSPTLWEGNHDNCRQIWFPGVHGDVGGGFKERGLSDGALQWMIDESKACAGVGYRRDGEGAANPDALDVLHDSRKGLWKLLLSAPRAMPNLEDASVDPFHESVHDRRANLPVDQARYLPVRQIGDGVEFDVSSRPIWTWTGLYLEAGKTYEFEASGEWVDRNIVCGPGGADDDRFHLGEVVHLVGSVFGRLERLIRRVTGQERVNLPLTRRFEHADWFELVGVIADGGNPGLDGTHDRHETFAIGEGCRKPVGRSGYLYCFANDAWGFYDNNRGFVTVKVRDVTT